MTAVDVQHARVRSLPPQPIGLAATLAGIIVAVTMLFVAAYFLWDARPEPFLRDPNATAQQPEYYGVMSNLGVLGWAVTAAISLFAGLALSRRARDRRAGASLIAGGVLTAALCLDDLFMLHDGLLLRLGLPETPVYAFYALAAAAYFASSWRLIRDGEWLLLGLAMAGLGGSVVMDAGLFAVPAEMLWEDMLKLFGILCWSAYFLRFAWARLTN